MRRFTVIETSVGVGFTTFVKGYCLKPGKCPMVVLWVGAGGGDGDTQRALVPPAAAFNSLF